MSAKKKPTGEWTEAGGRPVRPSLMDKQVDALLQLRALLEGESRRLEGELARAKEALSRIEHGGGL